MAVTVKFDDGEFGQFLRLFPAEARKAGLYALGEAAKVMQTRVRTDLASRVTYRTMTSRRFMERQVKVDFYKAGGPEQVKVHSIGPNTEPDRQLLPKFAVEGGGRKVGRQGGSLAVPIKARPSKGAAVSPRFRIAKLGLKPGPNGTLISTQDKRVWADKQSIKMRVGRGKKARVDVLWSFRKETRVPTPIRWGAGAEAALAAWPAIAAKAVVEKAAHLLKKGRASLTDLGFRQSE